MIKLRKAFIIDNINTLANANAKLMVEVIQPLRDSDYSDDVDRKGNLKKFRRSQEFRQLKTIMKASYPFGYSFQKAYCLLGTFRRTTF